MYTNMDSFNNKRSEFQARVANLNPDVIGLTEVKPKNATWSLCQQDLMVHGYKVYTNLEGRGVALYVKNSIQSCEIRLDSACEDAVWCEVKLHNRDILAMGVVYRSPNATDNQNDIMMSMITEIVDRKFSHLLITGDFNYPGIDWSSQRSEKSWQEQTFLESFRDWFLWQHVEKPTRYRVQQTANILDLVITNEQTMIGEINYGEPVGKSDHLCLDWVLKCYATEKDRSTQAMKYAYNSGNYDEMRRYLREQKWEELLHDGSVDTQWKIISEKIKEVVNKYVPCKKFSGGQINRKPQWMNDRVLSRIKQKKSAFEHYKQTSEGKDYLAYNHTLRQEILQRKRQDEQSGNMKRRLLYSQRKIQKPSTDTSTARRRPELECQT